MSVNKKYFFLRLKENYFEQDAIVLLESMPDGILYSNILLKLYLKSLKHDGKLQLDEGIPLTTPMLAALFRQQVGTIEHALKDAPVFGASHAEAKIATDPLSDREEQVVRLVCEGLTNRQIAERLGVSKRTIEFFRANAMRKLGAHNAKELQHRFQLKY